VSNNVGRDFLLEIVVGSAFCVAVAGFAWGLNRIPYLFLPLAVLATLAGGALMFRTLQGLRTTNRLRHLATDLGTSILTVSLLLAVIVLYCGCV
jgi:hypothetical protein